MSRPRLRAHKGFTLIELMIVIAIIAILAGVLIPNFVHARAKGQLTSCCAGLKSIATALEVYGSENGGHFPASLATLTPNFLKTLPTCPSVHSDTYSASFLSGSNPDGYTIVCGTLGHVQCGVSVANYPQYTSIRGLVEQP